jgi:hypothetical protein
MGAKEEENWSVTIVDTQSPDYLEASLRATWLSAGNTGPMPPIIPLTESRKRNRQIIKTTRVGFLVLGGANAAKLEVLPDSIFDAVGSVYMRHHGDETPLDDTGKCEQTMILGEAARVARPLSSTERAVLTLDASREARVITQVGAHVLAWLHAWGTGQDFLVTHARGWTPEQALTLGGIAHPKLNCDADYFGPDIKTPFGTVMIPLQVFLTGFDAKRIRLRRIGATLYNLLI